MRGWRIPSAVGLVALAGPVAAGETVDVTPVAQIYEQIGCRGNEKDIFPHLGSIGVSDFVAQIKALGASGHLVSDDNGETMRLTNWGSCP